MKILSVIFIVASILLSASRVHSQNSYNKQQELVSSFLDYIKVPGWKIDSLIGKYLLFRSDESPKYSRNERRMIISFAVSYLSTELQNIDFSKVIIIPYLKADLEMQKMFLRENSKENVIIAYTPDKQFLRYFWIEGNRIKSFVTFKQGKVFVLLN